MSHRLADDCQDKTAARAGPLRDHPDVATGYNNLGALLQDQGKYAEAEQLFRRAIEIDENAFGNPVVAKNYNNLAGLLRDQRKYGEAETLCRSRRPTAAPSCPKTR